MQDKHASANFGTVIGIGREKKFGLPIPEPVSTTYAALGVLGGVNDLDSSATPTEMGIRLCRNDKFLPFKLNYTRITDSFKLGEYSDSEANVGGRNWSFLLRPASLSVIDDKPVPTSIDGTFTLKSFPVGNDNEFDTKVYLDNNLSITPGSEYVQKYDDVYKTGYDKSGFCFSTVNYAAQNNAKRVKVKRLEHASSLANEWFNHTFLRNENTYAQKNQSLNAAICDYSEIEVDDALISNVQNLMDDLFIIVGDTVISGVISPYEFNNNLQLSSNVDFNPTGTVRPQFEAVFPLTGLTAQNRLSYRQTFLKGSIEDASGSNAWGFSSRTEYTVSTVPFEEVNFIEFPQQSGTIGPFNP